MPLPHRQIRTGRSEPSNRSIGAPCGDFEWVPKALGRHAPHVTVR